MTMETLATHACFGGTQSFHRHESAATGTSMRFAVYTPPQASDGPVPVLWFLAGLTCTEENFTVKGGAQRAASELGLMLIAPDTSPRGEGVPDDADGAYDFGLGAGFYVDATQAPWSANYRMWTYVTEELPALVAAEVPAADRTRQSISGHSMGGHGALTIGLSHPGRFRSIGAFAPIVAPSEVPWGEKALGNYLGPDRAAWRAHDAVALVEDGARAGELLIEQGTADPWLETQLKPNRLETVCRAVGQSLTLNRHASYDHGYFFVQTFIDAHLAWHRARMG